MGSAGFFSSEVTALFFLMLFLAVTSVEGALFSSLQRTLIVSASTKEGEVMKAGEDKFTVSWALNRTKSTTGTDSSHKKIKVMLCYAPVSQKDRGWRKTVDDLGLDKTCQFEITTEPYTASNTSYEYMIKRDVPSATYFIRAYVLDANDKEVGYGQTTDKAKGSNLFQVEGITGRTASLDIAAGCFSAFSILSLVFFFVKEKRMGKK
ncbi:uncharacterized protein A4U43_C02F3820 [Asparagus officinalis]|uniref:High-affinity nitrate transporter n=1 Tax=Asparagus officinalis TaxID=4686 RepID=A0A5P1FKQ3_ASPOF|nr:high-affinity nitrate transporter-activating protein 2.1-like [Asparagus officinalis]ONK77170.1 uncharacterized protein A4U43_C02F3820 [Asparagus officinalis]